VCEHISYQNEDYLNHSQDPNLIYHCGFLFALRNIEVGDELTVNYGYFLAIDDVESFQDIKSGKIITGLSGQEALLFSTRELLTLLET
jgi:hypothetical protein